MAAPTPPEPSSLTPGAQTQHPNDEVITLDGDWSHYKPVPPWQALLLEAALC
jgi:hypothetical protein